MVVSKSGMTNIYYACYHLLVHTYVNKCRPCALSQDVAPASCPATQSRQPLLHISRLPLLRSTNYGHPSLVQKRAARTTALNEGFVEKKRANRLAERVRNLLEIQTPRPQPRFTELETLGVTPGILL